MTSYHLLTATELRALELEANLVWPTIVAKRDGIVIGRLGTLDYEDKVVAGDLWIEDGITPLVTLRLLEMYEVILQGLGITEYLFSIAADNHKWKRIIEKAGMVDLLEDVNGFAWYRRTISEQRRRRA